MYQLETTWDATSEREVFEISIFQISENAFVPKYRKIGRFWRWLLCLQEWQLFEGFPHSEENWSAYTADTQFDPKGQGFSRNRVHSFSTLERATQFTDWACAGFKRKDAAILLARSYAKHIPVVCSCE